MTDEKKHFDQLSKDDLKDVKGGIPYEKPDLLELSGTSGVCKVGRLCETGDSNCISGTTCGSGTIGGPGIIPFDQI